MRYLILGSGPAGIAAAKAARVEQVGCLILFFSKTPDGWRNCLSKNAPLDARLDKQLAACPRIIEPNVKKHAADFVDLLARGKLAEAVSHLDDAARRTLPEAKLAEFWREAGDEGGRFLGPREARVERAAEYFNVFVPCRWEKKLADVKITLNLAGRISGVWAVPRNLEAAAAGADPPESVLPPKTGTPPEPRKPAHDP